MLIIYAYVLTRRFWRDLEIVENSHAGDSVICNMDFYDAVYTEMSKEIDKWLKIYIELLFLKEDAPESEFTRPAGRAIIWLLKQYGEWDFPKKVKDRYRKDIPEFLLRGEFKKACENGLKLDDATMCILNHDIYDRMYTLLGRHVMQKIYL